MRWVTSPTLPHTSSTPAFTHALRHGLGNKVLTFLTNLRIAKPYREGGRGVSYEQPMKFPLNGLKKQSIFTPSRTMLIEFTWDEL